jgi:hypothetical protein
MMAQQVIPLQTELHRPNAFVDLCRYLRLLLKRQAISLNLRVRENCRPGGRFGIKIDDLLLEILLTTAASRAAHRKRRRRRPSQSENRPQPDFLA